MSDTMRISRIDLDGKGSGSPEGLVAMILKAEPLRVPVPIEELAYALDIKEIAELTTEGFEGALLTDQYRSKGSILVRKTTSSDAGAAGRRRFTIGHELAHFLIPTHKPVRGDHFLCDRDAMRMWSTKEQDTYVRMEVEANRFSALILMPPPLLRPYLAKLGQPDLNSVLAVHTDFEVSKDAAARAFAQYHDQAVAVVVAKDGVIQRMYKGSAFPRLSVGPGDAVPSASTYHRSLATNRHLSTLTEVTPGQWLDANWGVRPPDVSEQVLLQRSGYALILLWTAQEEDDEQDSEEDMTAKQRFASRQSRW
jgi:hypothetical protein